VCGKENNWGVGGRIKIKVFKKKEKGFIMGRGEKPIIMLWPILNKHMLIY
jgi:hypothetical protein